MELTPVSLSLTLPPPPRLSPFNWRASAMAITKYRSECRVAMIGEMIRNGITMNRRRATVSIELLCGGPSMRALARDPALTDQWVRTIIDGFVDANLVIRNTDKWISVASISALTKKSLHGGKSLIRVRVELGEYTSLVEMPRVPWRSS
jgi:hypothetical protein